MERKGLALAACVTVGLMLFIATPYAQAGGALFWNRLDGGSWLRTTFDPDTGEPGISMVFVLIPKNFLGKQAAVQGSFLNPDPGSLFGGHFTDWLGEVVMTGRSTYKATAYTYLMVPNPEPDGRDLVAFILVANAIGEFVNQDLAEGTQTGGLYLGPGNPFGLPSQDTDGDLIPDLEVPGFPIPIPTTHFVDKRTPIMP